MRIFLALDVAVALAGAATGVGSGVGGAARYALRSGEHRLRLTNHDSQADWFLGALEIHFLNVLEPALGVEPNVDGGRRLEVTWQANSIGLYSN